MPEYLSPGVYVEEVSFRSKSIEGVGTTTTGFVGPTRYGPIDAEPELLTSLLDFERTYGDRGPLRFAVADDPATAGSGATTGPGVADAVVEEVPNDLWHAARAFFENGGQRLYVQRVYRPEKGGGHATAVLTLPPKPTPPDGGGAEPGGVQPNGGVQPTGGAPGEGATGDETATGLRISARYPGAAGARRVRLTLRRGLSALTTTPAGVRTLAGLREYDVVLLTLPARDEPPTGPAEPTEPAEPAEPTDGDGPGPGDTDTGDGEDAPKPPRHVFAVATLTTLPDGSRSWLFTPAPSAPPSDGTGNTTGGTGNTAITLATATGDDVPLAVAPVTLSVTDLPSDPDAPEVVWADLPLDARHRRGNTPDSVFDTFPEHPANRADAAALPVYLRPQGELTTGLDVLDVLIAAARAQHPGLDEDEPSPLEAALVSPDGGAPEHRSVTVVLTGGSDGHRPAASDYEGGTDPATDVKTGLVALEDLEEIAIVAAPGATRGYESEPARGLTILGSLISHCERLRYRIAVLDAGENQSLSQVRALRAQLDSTHAALYYPWVRILDPLTQREIAVPPSGFVAGIYARNDVQRAVYKAPANEVVSLALGFERTINKGQQDVLNPEGINCLRYFPGRGYRVWGARTVSSDPEWKYVNLRRYFAYVEHSVDRGTQWAVFEPNGDLLWGNVRRTISDFLYTEWENGALLGEKAEQAFFVRCDRSTMTRNDLDNGRLVCLVGISVVRPAEFVVFRIGQWTADRR